MSSGEICLSNLTLNIQLYYCWLFTALISVIVHSSIPSVFKIFISSYLLCLFINCYWLSCYINCLSLKKISILRVDFEEFEVSLHQSRNSYRRCKKSIVLSHRIKNLKSLKGGRGLKNRFIEYHWGLLGPDDIISQVTLAQKLK